MRSEEKGRGRGDRARPASVRPDHDHGYKLLFSHPELVADLLRGFVPEEWVSRVDLRTLERVSGSLVGERPGRRRESDVIWRVQMEDSAAVGPGPVGDQEERRRRRVRWVYVYVLIEFQSRVLRMMALRVHEYVGLLYHHLIRERLVSPRGRLPPVFPIVLYNGEKPWKAPLGMADLIEPVGLGLERYLPAGGYLLLDEHHPKAAGPLYRNLADTAFRLERCRTVDELQGVLLDLKTWLRDPELESLRRAFVTFLQEGGLAKRLQIHPVPATTDLEEVGTMLARRVREWEQEWKREAFAEGEARGEARGVSRVLTRQLEAKFGPLSPEVRERILAASEDERDLLAMRLLDAATLAEVLAP